ncbi:MAG: chorismate mutase [Thermoplasmata archaeon]
MGFGALAPPLDRLRAEIAELDRALVRLLARRMVRARRAVRLRLQNGGPRTDPGQEARVRARGRRWAREYGIPEGLVDRWLVELMEMAKRPEDPPLPAVRQKLVVELPAMYPRSSAGGGRRGAPRDRAVRAKQSVAPRRWVAHARHQRTGSVVRDPSLVRVRSEKG